MATESLPNTEISILSRIIDPEDPSLSADAARSILAMDFQDADHDRMAELVAKNQAGELSEVERFELTSYVNVGHLLALWQSKARVSLQRADQGS